MARQDLMDLAPRAAGSGLRFPLWPLLGTLAVLLAMASLYLIVQHSVNTQLGFDYATPRVSWREERFVITRVDPGGVMALAGLRVDDRVRFDDVSKLYALLILSQGGTAGIPIIRDGQARTVVVRVPRMKLPLAAGLRRVMYEGYWAEMRGACGGGARKPSRSPPTRTVRSPRGGGVICYSLRRRRR